jgi:hypothetical protein
MLCVVTLFAFLSAIRVHEENKFGTNYLEFGVNKLSKEFDCYE